MPGHLVLIGAGHAHLTVMKETARFIDRGHQVTVVSDGAFQYYSGMGPGLLSGRYRPAHIRFDVAAMVAARKGRFLNDRVMQIDPHRRELELASGRRLTYDILSLNAGSEVPFPIPEKTAIQIYPAKPVEIFLEARTDIAVRLKRGQLKIVVAGGGPAGVEIAANVRSLVRRLGGQARITLITRGSMLAQFIPAVRRKAMAKLKRLGIHVLENASLSALDEQALVLTNGRKVACDTLFPAVGTRPPPLIKAAGLAVDKSGGLLVNHHLQSLSHPNVFGGGDCIAFQPQPLARVGVYAVRQNPILDHNLQAALEGRELEKFIPQHDYLLILNMGDGTGILNRGRLTFGGWPAFWLKHYIDTRFMLRFQLSNERRRGGNIEDRGAAPA
ncbi:MAG: FAD-dependent oxidoreductase [Desulfobacterales bacterium]|nr:FAD-dependent oxidoreductase [Desulfobacterales bacterium]